MLSLAFSGAFNHIAQTGVNRSVSMTSDEDHVIQLKVIPSYVCLVSCFPPGQNGLTSLRRQFVLQLLKDMT